MISCAGSSHATGEARARWLPPRTLPPPPSVEPVLGEWRAEWRVEPPSLRVLLLPSAGPGEPRPAGRGVRVGGDSDLASQIWRLRFGVSDLASQIWWRLRRELRRELAAGRGGCGGAPASPLCPADVCATTAAAAAAEAAASRASRPKPAGFLASGAAALGTTGLGCEACT